MRKIVEKCPSCGRPDMVVTNLQCSECGTEVRGVFAASRFCRLSEHSLRFIETFVRNRGNLKEMERELNIAYATLRTRLNGVIQEMGYEGEAAPHGPEDDPDDETISTPERQEILTRLRNGDISAEEAIAALEEL